MARTTSSRRAATLAAAALSADAATSSSPPARSPSAAPRNNNGERQYQLRRKVATVKYASSDEEQTDEDEVLPHHGEGATPAAEKDSDAHSSDLSSQESEADEDDGDDGRMDGLKKGKGKAKRVPKKQAGMRAEAEQEREREKAAGVGLSFSNVPLKKPKPPAPRPPPAQAQPLPQHIVLPTGPIPRFIPPPPSQALLSLHANALLVLNNSRLEATRDESLQSASRRAVDVALEGLFSREQQEAFCTIMNRYTSFCTSPSADIPIFPLTTSKILLFLLRTISSPLGTSLLGLLPQPATHLLPLTSSHVNLARAEGSFVSQELVRCWCEALQYGQIASRTVWERILPGGGEARILILRDERVEEMLRQVESIVTLEARASHQHQKRKMEKMREMEAVESAEQGPSKKKARWSKGGRAVDGPSPPQEAVTPPEVIPRLNVARELSFARTSPTVVPPFAPARPRSPSIGGQARVASLSGRRSTFSSSLADAASRRSSFSLTSDLQSTPPTPKSATAPSSRRSSLSVSQSPVVAVEDASDTISPVQSRKGSLSLPKGGRRSSVALASMEQSLAETTANSMAGSSKGQMDATSRGESVVGDVEGEKGDGGEKENVDVLAEKEVSPNVEKEGEDDGGKVGAEGGVAEVEEAVVEVDDLAKKSKKPQSVADSQPEVVIPKPLTQAELEAALAAVHGASVTQSRPASQPRPRFSHDWSAPAQPHFPRQQDPYAFGNSAPHHSHHSLPSAGRPQGGRLSLPGHPHGRSMSFSSDPHAYAYDSPAHSQPPPHDYSHGYATYSSPAPYSRGHPSPHYSGPPSAGTSRSFRYPPSQPRTHHSPSDYAYSSPHSHPHPQSWPHPQSHAHPQSHSYPPQPHPEQPYGSPPPQFPLPPLTRKSSIPPPGLPPVTQSPWPTSIHAPVASTSRDGAVSMLLDGDGGGGEMSEAYGVLGGGLESFIGYDEEGGLAQ